MIDSKKRYHIIVVCDWKRNYHYRRVFKPMPEAEGNELSVDELKDVSGGLKGDHIMQHQLKGDDRGTYGVCNGGNRVVEELGDGDIELRMGGGCSEGYRGE